MASFLIDILLKIPSQVENQRKPKTLKKKYYVLSALVLLGLLVLCTLRFIGGPGYSTPEGFTDACYGGDFAKTLNGATPKFSIQIHITPEQWPALAQKFREFALTHNLQFFDTSVKESGLRMLNVHLCSSEGLWLYADKRIWNQGPVDGPPDEMPIYLFTYHQNYDWQKIASDLKSSLKDWPESSLNDQIHLKNGF